MTASSVNMGRKAVILAIFICVGAMFVTSFVYRMNHPNLFVQVQQQHTPDDGHDHGDGPTGAPPGMGDGMGAAMGQVKEYLAQVEADPNNVEALVNLGNSFLMMRAWDRALEPLTKAHELKPGNTDVLKAIGIAHFNKEDFTKASATYDEILEIEPNDSLALFNLGVIYKYYFEKDKVARTYFEKVLAVEKKDENIIKMTKQELEQ